MHSPNHSKQTQQSQRDAMPPAIFLMGPTASGKTDLALALSKRYPVEVISVDSALIYRGMDIGTAKPDQAFLEELPHFLIDVCNPDEAYSAARFRREALIIMRDISSRGNIPLLVGGTMLYFKVLLEGIADIPPVPDEVRQDILQRAVSDGWPSLHEALNQVDPVAAAAIHPNHSQRIQRALEVYEATGKPLSAYHAEQNEEVFPYRVLQLAIDGDRDVLHRRINERFERMLEQGFIDEVRGLKQRWALHADMASMRAVGYRQVWQYLDKQLTQEQLVSTACAATRQLAKRQLTWLRKWPAVHRIPLKGVGVEKGVGERDQLALIQSVCDEMNISVDSKRV